jgi:hypothetical protein
MSIPPYPYMYIPRLADQEPLVRGLCHIGFQQSGQSDIRVVWERWNHPDFVHLTYPYVMSNMICAQAFVPDSDVRRFVLMNSIPSFLRYAAAHYRTWNPPHLARVNRVRGPIGDLAVIERQEILAAEEMDRMDRVANLAAVEAMLIAEQPPAA